jgi:hypothetical protein
MKIPNESVQNMTPVTGNESKIKITDTKILKSEEFRRVLTTPCAKNHCKYTRRRQGDSLPRHSLYGLHPPSNFKNFKGARRFGSREAPTLVDSLDRAILSLGLSRSKGYTSAGVFCLKMEAEPTSETSCFFKQMDKVQKKKTLLYTIVKPL